MGCRIRTVSDDEGGAVSNDSFSEALLFTTMCLIGLPVDVHVKDGSVYSGIFHTACVENEYGVVLKKAKMIKKGKSDANVSVDTMIETLIVLSRDLVQVVAKGVLLPSEASLEIVADDSAESIARNTPCPEVEKKTTKSKKFAQDSKHLVRTRTSVQNGNGFAHGITRSFDESNIPRRVEKNLEEGQRKSSGHGLSNESGKINDERAKKSEEPSFLPVNGRQGKEDMSQQDHDECKEKFEAKEEEKSVCSASPPSDDGLSSPLQAVNAATSEEGVVSSSTPQGRVGSFTSPKEFKLNPEAKVFSPSYVNPLSATSMSSSRTYMPNNPPVIQVPVPQPEISSSISPYVPAKFVPYSSNVTAMNVSSASQYSQPIGMGRAHPVRYGGGQYHHPVQAVPTQTYVHPNSQAVMVGRTGQLLYVQHPFLIPSQIPQQPSFIPILIPAAAAAATTAVVSSNAYYTKFH